MAHVHTHEHQDGNYYLDQLLIVAFSGALGVIVILLYYFHVLKIFLNTQFHLPLLWGGVALLVLVVIRAVNLWVVVGRTRLARVHSQEGGHEHCHHDHEHGDHHHDHEPCDHDHEHDHAHACGHDHHDHDHDHTHTREDDCCGHDHGFAPWRYMVLMVPVALFLLRMPWPVEEKDNVPANVEPLKLTEAERTAADPQQRAFWTNETKGDKRVQLKAKVENLWHTDKMFGLVRMRMTCCYADAYGEPVKIVIETPKHPIDYDLVKSHGGWVKVIGKLDYRQLAGGDYITVVQADSWQALKRPPVNQFDN